MTTIGGEKPVDVGSGRICASFDFASAAWLSVGMTHPTHGFVELSALPAFDEARRGDPDATRLHRRKMTFTEHAFLRIEIPERPVALRADLSNPVRPRWSGDGVNVQAEAPTDGDVVRQSWTIDPPYGSPVLRLRGTLDRPALAEITEVNPPPATGAMTSIRPTDAGSVVIIASDLPARLEVVVDGWPVTWTAAGDELVGTLDPSGTAPTFSIEVRRGDRLGGNPPSAPTTLPLVDRALAYVRGCTALRTAADERTILTDHRILPLSWTRDGYWQALALLAADGPGDRERVADHLRWLWRSCERPDGRWSRSHHADGRRKDLAFQADQQLYPIVELADYWRLTGRLPRGVDWSGEVWRAWQAALAECDPVTGLIASAENAADDPVEAPYLGASQILLWYTAARLAEVAGSGQLEVDAEAIRHVAVTAQASFSRWFAADGEVWPSAIDARGKRVAYHDANDLPVALAPLWGLCRPDHRGWRATMAFAFSERNPAFFGGERGGLGSVHTPGPWSLGDLQAWIAGRCLGDDAACTAAMERLGSVAFVDGMLPEAYSAGPGPDMRVRHWFAWPGAALAALRLLDEAGSLRRRLAVRVIA